MRRSSTELVLLVALAAGCASGPKPFVARRVHEAPGVDVSAKNLPADEEVDQLLRGEPELGRVTNIQRVAVLPMHVASGPDAWAGDALAELMSVRFANVDGVWALGADRIAAPALFEDGAPVRLDAAKAVEIGRLLNVKYVVFGLLTPVGSGFRADVKLVEVSDARAISSGVATLGGDWRERANALADQLGRPLGFYASGDVLEQQAYGKRLRLVAEARVLGRQGELKLALANLLEVKPRTMEWRVEADVLRLLRSLQDTEQLKARQASSLAKLPRTPRFACPRALLATSWHDVAVAAGRAQVRAAASCGDPGLIVYGLVTLAFRFENVHRPSAIATFTRAATFGERASSAMRCKVAHGLHRLRYPNHTRVPEAAKGYARIGEGCAEAGNWFVASIALSNASAYSAQPRDALAYLERAVAFARNDRGWVWDRYRIALADAHRRLGEPERADDLLVDAMRERVACIRHHAGTLGAPEKELPADFLARVVGGAAPTSRRTSAVAATACRKGLGELLDAWAERTRKRPDVTDSIARAELFKRVARGLRGESADKPPEQTPEAALAKSRLTLLTIESMKAAPLRARDVDLQVAVEALRSWSDAAAKTADERLYRRTVEAAIKVADWLESPAEQILTRIAGATMYRKAGKLARARELLEQAGHYQTNAWSAYQLANSRRELAVAAGDGDLLALYRAQIAAAEKNSTWNWVFSIHTAAEALNQRNPVEARAMLDLLDDAARSLEQAGDFDGAANALDRLAIASNYVAGVSSSYAAVSAQARRVAVIQRLGDPIKTADARMTLLREISRQLGVKYGAPSIRLMPKDPEVVRQTRKLDELLEVLVAHRNYFEAVRIVGYMPFKATGMLERATRALEWSKHLEGQKEYAENIALIYYHILDLADDPDVRRDARMNAQRLYIEAGNRDQAATVGVWSARRLSSQDEFAELLRSCFDLAAGDTSIETRCFSSSTGFAFRTWYPVSDPKAFEAFVDLGLKRRESDQKDTPQRRLELRTVLAMYAVLAGRMDDARRLDQEAMAIGRGTNRYALALHVARLMGAAVRVQPAYALELFDRFRALGAASDYFLAQLTSNAILSAALAGETRRYAELEQLGDRLTKLYPDQIQEHARAPLRAAVRQKRWIDAARAASKGARLIEQRVPRYIVLIEQLERFEALAWARAGKLREARKALARFAQPPTAEPEIPCERAATLEVAAGIAFAARRCVDGEKLKARAGHVRASCRPGVEYPTPFPRVMWTDIDAEYRTTNRCGRPFAASKDLLPD